MSIIKALESLDPVQYGLHCFYFNEKWQSILPNRFNKILIKKVFINRVITHVYKKLYRSKLRWRLSGRFSSAANIINASDCDVVIYPAQDGLAYQTNKKSIATIHDLMHRYEPNFEEYTTRECRNRDIHYSAICDYSNLILVDSIVGKQHVLDSYDVSASKIKVLPYVPPTYLSGDANSDIFSKFSIPKKFIFYPAQFWEHKNHFNLINAIKLLKDKGVDVSLVLVGAKKNNYRNVMNQIEELKLKSHIFVLGYVSNADLTSLYKYAIAMTYVSRIGPTNIPPLEALVTGCPLICSNIYSMPEQVGEAALLVDPKSAVDIAEKILLLWNDKALAMRLRSLGYLQSSKYSQDDFTRIFLSHLNELCDQ